MPFLYNKFHIKDLLALGYYPVENDMAKQIVLAGIVSLDKMKMYKKLARPDEENFEYSLDKNINEENI